MAISLGATTYTSVTWTSGDIITETKMDNMVANDQAYDSVAAQGVLLNNDIGLFGKESGGTNRLIAGINTSDNLEIGDSAQSGHTVLNAGSSKLVKFKTIRSLDGSGVYAGNKVLLSGTAFVTESAAQAISAAVSFTITFDARPEVVTSFVGEKNTAPAPGDLGDLDIFSTGAGAAQLSNPLNITTTGFTVAIKQASIDGAAAPNFSRTYAAVTFFALGTVA